MKRLFSLLVISLFLLSTTPTQARPAPNGVNNYISGGHLFVWWNNHYEDMGPYKP